MEKRRGFLILSIHPRAGQLVLAAAVHGGAGRAARGRVRLTRVLVREPWVHQRVEMRGCEPVEGLPARSPSRLTAAPPFCRPRTVANSRIELLMFPEFPSARPVRSGAVWQRSTSVR